MATWDELHTQVALNLELPSYINDSTSTLIQTRLSQIHSDICLELKIEELLTEATVNIDSTYSDASPIDLLTDLSVASFFETFDVSIDIKSLATRDDYSWSRLGWKEWLLRKNSIDGDIRNFQTWTLRLSDNKMFLGFWPTGTETWDVYFHYYANPSVYTAGANSPDLPTKHQPMLVDAVTSRFPQYFQGDRAATLAMHRAEYERRLKRALRYRDSAPSKITGRSSPARITFRVET